MSSTFFQGLDAVAKLVGRGNLVGSVVVDQVYAQYQHEGLDLRHPEGGQAKYLEEPFYRQHHQYLGRLADRMFESGPVPAMVQNMEDLSGQVFSHAPVEFGDLKASGHPSVTDDGAQVYDRTPLVHRLTEAELRAKGDVRNLGFGNR